MLSTMLLEICPGGHRVLGLLGDHARKLLECSFRQGLCGPIPLSLPLELIASVILDASMDSTVNSAPLSDQSALMQMIKLDGLFGPTIARRTLASLLRLLFCRARVAIPRKSKQRDIIRLRRVQEQRVFPPMVFVILAFTFVFDPLPLAIDQREVISFAADQTCFWIGHPAVAVPASKTPVSPVKG